MGQGHQHGVGADRQYDELALPGAHVELGGLAACEPDGSAAAPSEELRCQGRQLLFVHVGRQIRGDREPFPARHDQPNHLATSLAHARQELSQRVRHLWFGHLRAVGLWVQATGYAVLLCSTPSAFSSSSRL